MKRMVRAYFVNSQSKVKIDLGIFIQSRYTEGLAWTRAFNLVSKDSNGLFPFGRIEVENF